MKKGRRIEGERSDTRKIPGSESQHRIHNTHSDIRKATQSITKLQKYFCMGMNGYGCNRLKDDRAQSEHQVG